MFGIFDRNKTFKPVKNVQPGTTGFNLHKKLEETLHPEDSFTDTVMQESVKLPPGDDLNEWISVHTIDFYNKINSIYGILTEYCTDKTCPKMAAGANFQYLWRDPTSKQYKKATEVSAPTYIALSMDKLEQILNDEKLFPTGGEFPKDFKDIVKEMFKKIFRIYAHVFHHHYQEVLQLKMENNFQFAFKHFIFFAMEFRLLKEKELSPMQDWIEKAIGIDLEKYLKSKKSKHSKKEKNLDPKDSDIPSERKKNNKSVKGFSSFAQEGIEGHIRRRSSSVLNDEKSTSTSSINTSISASSSNVLSNDSHINSQYTVEPNKISTLIVEVIEAHELAAKDLGGTSDGYAVLKFENQEFKTDVVWKDLNPKWNERFTFLVKNLNTNLNISVYDENKLSKGQLIGQVDFNCQELSDEEKHEVTLELKNSKDEYSGKIHLKLTFVSSESGSMSYLKKLTNLSFYEPLKKYLLQLPPNVFVQLFDNNRLNCDDKIYKSIIYLTTFGEQENVALGSHDFSLSILKYVIRCEVEKTNRISQLLRSNNISTKLVGMYVKIFGQTYLRNTLQSITQRICEEDKFLECNYELINGKSTEEAKELAHQNMNEIISYCKEYMNIIKKSIKLLPMDIRLIISHLREQVMKKYKSDNNNLVDNQVDPMTMGSIAASSLLFLRFITPCITAPLLFNLISAPPTKNAQRTLMLISKILQQTANQIEFSEKKEQYMVPANQFIKEEMVGLNHFLEEVCNISDNDMIFIHRRCESITEENSDKVLWALYNIHSLFYDNDPVVYPLLLDTHKKSLSTSHFAYFEIDDHNEVDRLLKTYENVRNIISKLGPPPQLSLQARQRVATAFTRKTESEIPQISINN
ncbi:hypothetical protein ABK040_007183 [Willaertia magna]